MDISLSAAVLCSSQMRPKSLPESSDRDDQSPSASASHGTGDQTTVPKDSSLVSVSDCPVEVPSASLPTSACSQLEVARLPECQGAGQTAQSKHSLMADQSLRVPPGRTPRSSQSPKKPFNSLIEHLSVVFPCYNR